MDIRMEGKRVLVTGAGTGIGRGIALEFARAGAAVALHCSHSTAGAEEAAGRIRAAGGRAAVLAADFTRREEVRGLAGRALEFLGGLDVLVNNAGITMVLPFEEVTDAQFDVLYAVNVAAPFFLTQALLPALRASRPSAVVNLTSIHALEGYAEHSVYAGTRGAVAAFSRELAVELAPLGVRVNAVAPGAIDVENHRKVSPEADLETAGRGIPAGFVGAPEDVARAVLFLASEEARFIVGQTMVVDGGTTSWMPFGEQFRERSRPGARLGRGYVPGI